MRKVVLRNLSPDIAKLITDRADEEHITPDEAVIEILRDAAVERAIQHDTAMIESWLEQEIDDGLDIGPFCRKPCCAADGA